MNEYVLQTPDDQPVYRGRSYQAALDAARKSLNVRRVYHDRRPWGEWLHASPQDGCASLELLIHYPGDAK